MTNKSSSQRNPRQTARTPRTVKKSKAAFLDALSQTGSITWACELAGVPRRTAYDWRGADKAFRKAWAAALELGVDAMEDEAVRRAQHGTDKPVFHRGAVCGKVREYSDTLLIFMLKARRPDKFKDRAHVDHSVEPIKELLALVNDRPGSRGVDLVRANEAKRRASTSES